LSHPTPTKIDDCGAERVWYEQLQHGDDGRGGNGAQEPEAEPVLPIRA
jgi:hypothetical protein